jgi:hypothetical protein
MLSLFKLGATYDVGMGILDDARKEEDESKAATLHIHRRSIRPASEGDCHRVGPVGLTAGRASASRISMGRPLRGGSSSS